MYTGSIKLLERNLIESGQGKELLDEHMAHLSIQAECYDGASFQAEIVAVITAGFSSDGRLQPGQPY